jgi:hypothetical protein
MNAALCIFAALGVVINALICLDISGFYVVICVHRLNHINNITKLHGR